MKLHSSLLLALFALLASLLIPSPTNAQDPLAGAQDLKGVFGSAGGLKATQSEVPEALMSLGGHVQRLNSTLSAPWPGISVNSEKPMVWGVSGHSYMESLAMLAEASGSAPGFFFRQLRFEERPNMIFTEGPVMIIVTTDGFSKDSLNIYMLIEPTLRVSDAEMFGRVGGKEVKVKKESFEFESVTGFSGLQWKIEGAAALLGDVELTLDMEVITEMKSISISCAPDASVDQEGIQLSVRHHKERKNYKDEMASGVGFNYSGAPLLGFAPKNPKLNIAVRGGSWSGDSGSFSVDFKSVIPPESEMLFVFTTKSQKHQIKHTFSGINFAEWFPPKK